MSLKVYDADQVSIIIAGISLESGFADGEFCRIERETEAFTDVVGTDGEVTRSKTRDGRATVTVLLMQSSSGNQLLSALHNIDKRTPGGAGVGPMLIKDNNGNTLHASPECWIQTSPDVSYDREATAREWTIRCSDLEDVITGTGGALLSI